MQYYSDKFRLQQKERCSSRSWTSSIKVPLSKFKQKLLDCTFRNFLSSKSKKKSYVGASWSPNLQAIRHCQVPLKLAHFQKLHKVASLCDWTLLHEAEQESDFEWRLHQRFKLRWTPNCSSMAKLYCSSVQSAWLAAISRQAKTSNNYRSSFSL